MSIQLDVTMAKKKRAAGSASAARNGKKRNPEKELAILEGALRVFGEKGYEAATVSAICQTAGVSEPTLYEYFGSKEDVLFAISEFYTQREVDRVKAVAHYIHHPREKLRVIIQAYLEFYEANPLYTSVALLTLKGNRRYASTTAYEAVRDAARPIVEAFREGVERGVFREDLDPYLVRNMILGFIEHLTTQWLVIGRPERIADQRDAIFEMVMRAIEKPGDEGSIELRISLDPQAARRLFAGDGDLPAVDVGGRGR